MKGWERYGGRGGDGERDGEADGRGDGTKCQRGKCGAEFDKERDQRILLWVVSSGLRGSSAG